MIDPAVGYAIVAFCYAAGAGGVAILGLLAWCWWKDRNELKRLGEQR